VTVPLGEYLVGNDKKPPTAPDDAHRRRKRWRRVGSVECYRPAAFTEQTIVVVLIPAVGFVFGVLDTAVMCVSYRRFIIRRFVRTGAKRREGDVQRKRRRRDDRGNLPPARPADAPLEAPNSH
jgi:hypothetical protein